VGTQLDPLDPLGGVAVRPSAPPEGIAEGIGDAG
jgi:hypothetical protein